jgi:DNA-binding SARP family transcriptional activator
VEELRLQFLGGFAVERAGKPVTAFESDKCRLLLAYLAVESDRPHRRERLAGIFWPDKPENNAHHNLSQALWSLNKSLQDSPHASPIEATTKEIRLLPQDTWLDVQEFQSLIRACSAHGHTAIGACRPCLERLEDAAALYKGDFLAGYALKDSPAFEEWLMEQQEALRKKIIWACQRLSHGYALLREDEKALQFALRQLALDPLDESAHRQVMEVLVQSGKRAEALKQYTACQEILKQELDTEP